MICVLRQRLATALRDLAVVRHGGGGCPLWYQGDNSYQLAWQPIGERWPRTSNDSASG